MKVAVSRAPGAERLVTPLELFFDLVYVFAVGELSHHLLEHVDLRTGAETVILALAVFYAWYMNLYKVVSIRLLGDSPGDILQASFPRGVSERN